MLKVVSIDIAGTLIDYYYFDYVWEEIIPQLYAKKRSLSPDVAKDYVLREYDRIGSNDIRWYLPKYWFQRFNLDEDPLEVFGLHTDKIRVYSDAQSILEKLSQNYDLVTASGIPRNIQIKIIEKLGINFKHIFSSITDLQEVKKTTKFYEMICKVLGIKPKQMIHIGDDWLSDYIVPRKVGIQSFLLNRKGERKGKDVLNDLGELEHVLKIVT